MKVSGFTIARNAEKLYYPIKESILSILPIVDEFIVALGKGDEDDQSRELIESIGDKKIKIIDTVWDDTLREGGKVLALETNKALRAVSPDSDWCFYLQGDEVIHEKYLPDIRHSMENYLDDTKVEGLLFKI